MNGLNQNGDHLVGNYVLRNSCTRCSKAQAILRCLTCSHYLCEHCSFHHSEIKAFQGHSIIRLGGNVFSSNCPNSDTVALISSKVSEILAELTQRRLSAADQKKYLCDEFEENLKREQKLFLEHVDEVYGEYEKYFQREIDRVIEFKKELDSRSSTEGSDSSTKSYSQTSSYFNEVSHKDYFSPSAMENNNLTLPLSQELSQLEDFDNLDNKTFNFLNLPYLLSDSLELDLSSSVENKYSQLAELCLCKLIGKRGDKLGYFNSPMGFCIGLNDELIVADTNNHRIQIFNLNGDFKWTFGTPGRSDGNLFYPRKIAYMKTRNIFVVCDRGYSRSRLQLFAGNGSFIKRVNINYVHVVAGIFVKDNEDIVIVDSAKSLFYFFNVDMDRMTSVDFSMYIQEASEFTYHGRELYVCDYKGHCIVVFNEAGEFLRNFGGPNTITFPNSIDVSLNGDVFVVDAHGNFCHLVIFTQEGQVLANYRCTDTRVSRCCTLKVTSQGDVLTIDKNYHHVLLMKMVPKQSN